MKSILYIGPQQINMLDENGKTTSTHYMLKACNEHVSISVTINEAFGKDIERHLSPMHWAIRIFFEERNEYPAYIEIIEMTDGAYLFGVYYSQEVLTKICSSVRKNECYGRDILC